MDDSRTRLILVVAILLLTFAGVRTATQFRMNQKHIPTWEAVPYHFGEWEGMNAQFDNVYGVDPAATSLLRAYRKGTDLPVLVYVGFYPDLTTILDVHTPELCYPAQGWTLLSTGKSVFVGYRHSQILEKEAVVDKDGVRRLVVWWYNAGSHPFQDRIRYMYAALVMSTITGRTDGSMVRLETSVAQGDEKKAHMRIEEFRKSFLPLLDSALPR